MPSPYVKVHEEWRDKPDLSTTINAAALMQIETGIADAQDTADDALALATAAGSDASTSAKGIVEIATSSEATTGTDAARVMTPATTKVVVDRANAFLYGTLPKVIWNGSSWPTRSSSLPPGYTGAVEYFSPWDAAASNPSDRTTNDLWTRKV